MQWPLSFLINTIGHSAVKKRRSKTKLSLQGCRCASSLTVAISSNASQESENKSRLPQVLVSHALIVPTVERLTASSPPLAILEDIYGLKQVVNRDDAGYRKSKLKKMMHRTRCQNKQQYLYQSKSVKINLLSSHARHPYSAWNRCPQSTGKSSIHMRSKSINHSNVRDEYVKSYDNCTITIVRAESQDSMSLPALVSPANRFIPIGHEGDDHIHMATLSKEIDDANDWSEVTDKGCGSHAESPFIASPVSLASPPPLIRIVTDITYDRYSHPRTVHQQQPQIIISPNNQQMLEKELESQQKYEHGAFLLDREDDVTIDWFPILKQEIFKVAMLINCGSATGTNL